MVSIAIQPAEDRAVSLAPRRQEIVLRDVSVSYPCGSGERRTVLSRLNIEIEEGEFVAILGETGCGKSTLLRLILGQEFPQEGSVEVDGKRVTRIDSRCGYVPQKYSLFPDRTVQGNLMYGPVNAHSGWMGRLLPSSFAFRRRLRGEVQAVLERMGLKKSDLQKYPHQLSGGMQQRVAIAQALLMKPPVLLMDEAFSALDPATRSSLQGLIRDVWLEIKPTVIFVTHNISEALLLATRLIVLRPHAEASPAQSNVILDRKLPGSDAPLWLRKESAEFRELHQRIERLAYRSAEDAGEELPGEDWMKRRNLA